MTRNTVYIRSGSNTIYLSGITHPAYVSGSPWSSEGTTPYVLSGNDTTGGVWTPAAPPLGADMWAPPIEETVGVQCYASDQDGLIYLKRLLHTALNYQAGQRPYLAVQSGTNTVYYDLYGARVQEDARYAVESGLMRLSVTWRRSAWGGRLGVVTSTETINSASAWLDRVSSAAVIAYGATATGDLITSGSPLNYAVSLTAFATDPIQRVMMASIASQDATSHTVSNTWSTSGTTYATGATITMRSGFNFAPISTNPNLRVKILTYCDALPTGNMEFRYAIYNGASEDAIYSAPIGEFDGDGANTSRVIESNPITLPMLTNEHDRTFTIVLQIRSTDGAATTGTVNDSEILLYYDWCDIRFSRRFVVGTTQLFRVYATRSISTMPAIVDGPPFAAHYSLTALQGRGEVRGTIPRYYAGASLWMRTLRNASSTGGTVYFDSNTTADVTVYHAPQFATLRGNV